VTTTPDPETAAAVDPPRPDPIRAALEERQRRLAHDERAYQRQLARLHDQQDSVTRDLLEAQALLADTVAALEHLPVTVVATW